MQAQLCHDPARGAGYGVIDIQNATGRETDILFSLRRASDGKFLGSGDWLEAEQRLAPDMVQYQGDSLRLLVGPGVVDMVDVLNTFAITIYPAAGEGSRCGLDVGDLVYSGLAGGQGVAQGWDAPLHLSPMPEMRLDPGSAAEPVPVTEPAPAAEPAPVPEPQLPELKEPVERTSRAPLILLLLLVCAAGGAYWWHVRTPESSPAAASAPAPAAEAAPQLRAPHQATPPPSLQRAREVLRTGIAPEQAVELAKTMSGAEGADGAFLLLEDAAQKGSPEAMLGLARFYDPADAAPKGSILPDPAQARTWYTRAKDRGQSAAEDKLKALRAWAEAEKDRNPQAGRLLESWN